jgi:biopolymer transport protein ExbD
MAMMLPDGAGDDELMVELNTTPLIDVLLVLLVMLILSIPPQWHAVNMGLPVSAKPPDIKPQVIVLEILPGNGLRWNGQAQGKPQPRCCTSASTGKYRIRPSHMP